MKFLLLLILIFSFPKFANADDLFTQTESNGKHDSSNNEWGVKSNSPDLETVEKCKSLMSPKKPRIEIRELKPSGGDRRSYRFKIEGVVLGACIDEAGYYEKRRLVEKFRIPLDERVRKYDFSVVTELDNRGELRAYTLDGKQDTIDLDAEIEQYLKTHLILQPGLQFPWNLPRYPYSR